MSDAKKPSRNPKQVSFRIPDTQDWPVDERILGRKRTLSIIIPSYNEERTIASLLGRLMAVELPTHREVIVVDDGSTDRTREKVQPFIDKGQVRYVKLARNSGKGAALRAGFALASGDFVLVQDADEEYDPRDIPMLLEPLLDGRARAVYGSRVINEHCVKRRHFVNPFWWGGRTLTLIANLLFRTCRISDEPVCYKMIRRDLLMSIPLRCTGFEFCPELTAKLSLRGVPIFNVPIRYAPRGKAAGKKISAKHWFEAVWCLLKNRLVNDSGPVANYDPELPDLAEDSA